MLLLLTNHGPRLEPNCVVRVAVILFAHRYHSPIDCSPSRAAVEATISGDGDAAATANNSSRFGFASAN